MFPKHCFFLVALIYVTSAAPNGPCKVGYRLDEVQDFFLVSTQQAIMQAFVDNKVPLTIGIISNFFGTDFDPNSQLVPFINNLLANGADIEIASNTQNHITLSSQSLANQTNAATQSKSKIASQLTQNKRQIRTMLCPTNQFNQNTLNALRTAGYTTISASNTVNTAVADGRNFYSSCSDSLVAINGITHTPSTSYTSNGNTRLPPATVLSSMESSMNACGFAVLEMHFQAFATNGQVNTGAINDLVTIMNTVKTWNCTARVLQDLSLSNGTPVPTVIPNPSSNNNTNTTPMTPRTPAPRTNQTGGERSISSSSHPLLFFLLASLMLHLVY